METVSGKAKDNGKWSIEQDIEAAAKNGMEIIRTTPTTLLVDLDSNSHLPLFEKQFSLLKDALKLSEIERYRSKSGTNWHIVLSCAPLTIEKRLLFQCLLGSDRKREALGILMNADGVKNPSVLFKPVGAGGVTNEKREVA